MEIDPTKIYMMPHIMGPQHDKDKLPILTYPMSETVAIQYQTDPQAARKLVPDCYQVDPEPIVTVVFGYHAGLDFLAGNGYILAAFQISAKFEGEEDQIAGDYNLVMFENQTLAILAGRDYLGVPKLYADIPPIKFLSDGGLRCEASFWGHLLFGLELPKLKKQNQVVRAVASKQINSRPWLTYKLIPALDGPPDADYPMTTRNDVTIDQLWMGKTAKLYFGTAAAGDIGPLFNVIEALKTLEMIKIKQVLHFKGSVLLRYDQTHRLK